MFNGKMKAVTFSYDDAVTQDQRLIEIFNKYGLKGTFNLNSGFLGTGGSLVREEVTVAHAKPRACEVRKIYEGHEVASHTLTHPSLKELPDEEIIRQVEEDRLALSEIVGYEVKGMAYPNGTAHIDDRTVRLIREHTGIHYARTTTSTGNFELQTNLLEFNPTVYHHNHWKEMFELAEQFLALEPKEPKLFYIWGHAYEFDIHNDWAKMEEFCRVISGKKDIFYGTNSQVLLEK